VRTFVFVDAHEIAVASAEQRSHGLIEQLAGQVPERDLDSAYSAQQHVGRTIDAGAQTVIERLDLKRVFADEVWAQLEHAFLNTHAGAAITFADPVDAGVGENLHQRVSTRALQHGDANICNACAAAFGPGQGAEGGQ
jgi:hypothetical protein